MATFPPNPGPEKLLAHQDGTKQGWVAQGLKVTNTYHGRCALERRSSVPQRRDSGALVLAHLPRGLILGKSLTDSEPQFSPLSDGLQLALPIFPRPLGEGHREKSGGNIVGNGGSSSASGGKRRPRLGVP